MLIFYWPVFIQNILKSHQKIHQVFKEFPVHATKQGQRRPTKFKNGLYDSVEAFFIQADSTKFTLLDKKDH